MCTSVVWRTHIFYNYKPDDARTRGKLIATETLISSQIGYNIMDRTVLSLENQNENLYQNVCFVVELKFTNIQDDSLNIKNFVLTLLFFNLFSPILRQSKLAFQPVSYLEI